MFSCSKYFTALSEEDQKWYTSKLTLKDGHTLPDPYSLIEDWKNEVSLLPDITWPDVYNYLINTPSSFSKESLKAYKSLEAYNFFICGHVQDVFYHEIGKTERFCFIKSEVLPSQRQGKKSQMYGVWVAIHKKDGWILTANCECMAGLGSVCSHAAALLFKLQTCSQMELNKAACTSKLCAWKRSRQHAEAAPLKQIDFRRPKKDALPMKIPSYKQLEGPFSSGEPASYSNNVATIEKLKELKRIAPNAAIFSSFVDECDESAEHLEAHLSETDTAEESDENSIPEPLVSLFQPAAINDSIEELNVRMNKLFSDYKKAYCQTQYANLCEVTRCQSITKVWQIHRAGRITASIAKQAFNADKMTIADFPKSFMKTILQYGDPVDVPATRYGKAMEPVARKDFIAYAKTLHEGFSTKETGLHVLEDKPYLGASPDGLTECCCHGKGVLEIKCPYKYRNGLHGWHADKSFPVSPNGDVRKNHTYFFQMQHQMLVTGTNYCYFYVWTKGQNVTDKLLLTVKKDIKFCEELEQKLTSVFFKFVLPELVTRRNDPNNEQPEKLYCKCRRPTFLPMIACEGDNCKIEWFHYGCVGITRAPEKNWYCEDCKKSTAKK